MLEHQNVVDHLLKLIQQSLDMLHIGMVQSIHLNGSYDVRSIGVEQSIHNDSFKMIQWCLKYWGGVEYPFKVMQ
jgi:hypothetical protein